MKVRTLSLSTAAVHAVSVLALSSLAACPAWADEPAPTAAAPADAKPADGQPCAGKDHADCGGCCDDGEGACCDDDGPCCGGDGAPCDGKAGDKPAAAHSDADKKDGDKKDGDKKAGEHHGHGGFGGGILGGFKGLKPIVLLQTQVGLLAGDDNLQSRGDVVEHPGSFVLRRARLGLAGHATERVTFALSVDLAKIGQDGSTGLNDAYASLRWLHHQDLKVGAQMVPYSRFAMLSAGDQALAQRPKSVDAMAPFRQLGASLHGAYDIVGLQWWVGAYNSFERKVNFFDGVAENSYLAGNRTGGVAVAGRVQLEPLGAVGEQVADRGGRNKKFRFELGGGGIYNDAGATTSYAVSGDVHLKWYGAHLLFEYLLDSASPKDAPTVASIIPATLKRSAIVVEAGYAWWLLNAAVRAELIDPNSTVKDNHDETIISGAVGLSLPKQKARVQLQYDHRQETNGPALKNDTLYAQFQLKL